MGGRANLAYLLQHSLVNASIPFEWNKLTHASHTAHTTKVILRRLVLFILVNPLNWSAGDCYTIGSSPYLVKISLEEVHFLRILEESWPEFPLQLLLPKNHLDVLCSMVDFALLINLRVKL